MSRRRLQAADSLELLLDTLCNTFGGVLFIAILVVVLLQMSGDGVASRPRDPIDSADLHDLADELEVLRRERDSLLHNPQSSPGDPSESETTASRMRAVLAESEARLEDVERRKDAMLVETGRTDASALELDEEAAEIKERPQRIEQEIEELRKQIDEVRRLNSRTVRTPLAHSTRKQGLAIELRYDRLYLVHAYDALGRPIGPNLDEYVLLNDTESELEITADPTLGTPITSDSGFSGTLQTRLVSFKPDAWYLDVVVRSGSFGAFHAFQEASHKLGYEMRILPVPDADSFQDRGGERSDVQ